MPGPADLEELLSRFGMEGLGRYYGPFRGIVLANNDPDERGRIQVYVARSMGTKTTGLEIWVDPMCQESGANRGSFWPPEVDDTVWVYFDNGASNRPVGYVGGWFSQSTGNAALPSEFAYQTKTGSNGQKEVVGPNRRGFITRQGHQLIFDDTAGEEAVSLVWHQPATADLSKTDRKKTANRGTGKSSKLLFKKDGTLEISNANGSKFSLNATKKSVEISDENGNTWTMDKSGVSMETKGNMTLKGVALTLDFQSIALGKGAVSPILKAPEFALTYATHIHGTAVGPTTIPLVPVIPPSNQTIVVKAK